MDGILIRERYKVVQVLWRAENYAAVEVVDIQERENPSLLVNLYGGELLHRYGEIYAGMKDCPAFRGMFLEDGALAPVSHPSHGGDDGPGADAAGRGPAEKAAAPAVGLL